MGKVRESPLVGGVPGGGRVPPTPCPGAGRLQGPALGWWARVALGGQLCWVPVLSPRLEKATLTRRRATETAVTRCH